MLRRGKIGYLGCQSEVLHSHRAIRDCSAAPPAAGRYCLGSAEPLLCTAVLRRYAGWFLAAAAIFAALLLAGLIHDFGQPETGWLTTNPTLAGILVALAYISMVLYQFGQRGRSNSEEEE